MTGNILGEAISEKIDAQINNRQFIQGAGYNLGEQQIQRTPEVLNYLNNRNAWIKMASGVSISGSLGKQKLKDLSEVENSYLSGPEIDNLMNSNLAENLILFNTTQKFDSTKKEYTQRSGVRSSNSFTESINNMYGGLGGNSKGLEPVPGITDISIQCLNRGSIKKATVNIKAYNKFQFGVIELLYLRLGYIMMLEWGWDKYIDSIDTSMNPSSVTIKDMGSTIIENQWFKDTNYTQTEMLDIIQANREIYKGNYDGFFGTVTNFSWKLGKDNVYDITINLSTLGSVIESLNINIPIPGFLPQSNLGSDRLTNWINSTSTNFSDLLGSKDNQKNKNYVSVDNLYSNNNNNNNNYEIEIHTDPAGTKLKEKFIRLGHFLRIFQNDIIFNIDNGGEKNDKELKFDLNVESTLCNYEKNLIPLNPNKVIFSVLMGEEFKNAIGEKPFSDFNSHLKEFSLEEDKIIYGKLLNIYLNFDFIQKSFNSRKNEKNEVFLFKFLTSICDGINESTGQCTQLEVIIKDNKTITIIDQNQIKGYDEKLPPSPTPLNIYGYNPNNTSTFVKDFNIQTKITPDLANIITIGATAESLKTENAIPFKNINKGLDNRFGLKQTQSEPLEENKFELPSEEEFQKAFKDDLLDSNKTPYNVFSGYEYTYKGITFNVNTFSTAITKGIKKLFSNFSASTSGTPQEIEQRSNNGNNSKFLSEAYANYKEAFDQNQSKKIEESRQQSLQNARGSYQAYLAKSFGGKAGFEISQNQYASTSAGTGAGGGISGIKQVEKVFKVKNALYFKWDNQDHLSLAQSSFKRYLDKQNKEEYESKSEVISSQGFIPLELGITMEGLSGVKIYNKLNLNTKFLPSSYPKSLKFIATNVDHKVGGNIWETNIKTISMPLSENPPINPVILENTSIGRQNNVLIDQSEFAVEPYRTNLVLNPPISEARKIAQAYLGRNMSDEEWNNLVAATAAEASPNEEERAYVMAVILNRARERDTDILTILTLKNQFQAVTGTRYNNRQPSPNFINATQKTANAIFKGVEKYLVKVPKDFKFFTAASDKAYGEGTDKSFRDRIINPVIIGGTIFGVDVLKP